MPENNLPHLVIDGNFYDAKNYTSTIRGGHTVLARSEINRQQHGNSVEVRFNEALVVSVLQSTYCLRSH